MSEWEREPLTYSITTHREQKNKLSYRAKKVFNKTKKEKAQKEANKEKKVSAFCFNRVAQINNVSIDGEVENIFLDIYQTIFFVEAKGERLENNRLNETFEVSFVITKKYSDDT